MFFELFNQESGLHFLFLFSKGNSASFVGEKERAQKKKQIDDEKERGCCIKGLAISIFSIKREGPMLLALCSYQDCVSGRAPATDGRIMRVRAFIIFTSHCFPFPTIFIYGYHLKTFASCVRLYNVF